jgi:hypothetical protein
VARLGAPGLVGDRRRRVAIEPERAAECIHRLRQVVVDLAAAEQGTDRLHFPPPGWDDVSVNAADQAAIMADRAYAFILTWRIQLEQAADGLERQLADYRAAEAANRDRSREAARGTRGSRAARRAARLVLGRSGGATPAAKDTGPAGSGGALPRGARPAVGATGAGPARCARDPPV